MTTQQILKDAELQNPHRLTNDHIHAITRHFGRLAEPEDLTTRNKGAGTDIVQHMSGMTELRNRRPGSCATSSTGPMRRCC